MNKIYFEVEDDVVVKYTPMPELGEHICKNEVVMTKEIFQECYKKWVEPQKSDHKCHTCKHYTSGEHDGSCGSYICKGYSNWEREEV